MKEWARLYLHVSLYIYGAVLSQVFPLISSMDPNSVTNLERLLSLNHDLNSPVHVHADIALTGINHCLYYMEAIYGTGMCGPKRNS